MNNLSNIQKSYIAGFLDGDGSIYVKLTRNDTYRFGYQVAPYIVFYQRKDYKDYFETLRKMLGIGYIRIRKDGIVEYIIGDLDSLKKFINQISPYSRLKKRQLRLMSEILEKKRTVKTAKDFIRLSKLIDQFKNLNYSKKRSQTSYSVEKLLKNKGLLTP